MNAKPVRKEKSRTRNQESSTDINLAVTMRVAATLSN